MTLTSEYENGSWPAGFSSRISRAFRVSALPRVHLPCCPVQEIRSPEAAPDVPHSPPLGHSALPPGRFPKPAPPAGRAPCWCFLFSGFSRPMSHSIVISVYETPFHVSYEPVQGRAWLLLTSVLLTLSTEPGPRYMRSGQNSGECSFLHCAMGLSPQGWGGVGR